MQKRKNIFFSVFKGGIEMNPVAIYNHNSTVYLNPLNGKFIAIKETNQKTYIDVVEDKKLSELLRDDLNMSFNKTTCFIELIIINITSKCNLNCTYCYRGELKAKTVNVEDVILFLKEIKSYKKVTILFQGGEPLIEFEKIKYIVDMFGNRFNYAIQTNGVLLNDKICRYCKSNNIRVSISVDGIDYDDNKLRFCENSNDYYRMKENVEKYSQYLNIGAIAVISSKNMDKVLNITKYFMQNHIKLFSLNPIWPIGRGGGYQEEMICADNDKLVDNMMKVVEYLYSHNMKESKEIIREKNLYLLWQRIFFRKYENYMCTQNPCGAGNRTITIDTDGKIYPCTYFIEPQYSLGEIPICKSEKLYFFELSKEEVGQKNCQECIYRIFCGGGCTGATRLFGENPYCEYFKKIIPKLIDWQVAILNENIISNFKE